MDFKFLEGSDKKKTREVQNDNQTPKENNSSSKKIRINENVTQIDDKPSTSTEKGKTNSIFNRKKEKPPESSTETLVSVKSIESKVSVETKERPSGQSLCDKSCSSKDNLCHEKVPECATIFKSSDKNKIDCDCPKKCGTPFEVFKSRPQKTCNKRSTNKPLTGFPPYPYVKVLYLNETGIAKPIQKQCKACSQPLTKTESNAAKESKKTKSETKKKSNKDEEKLAGPNCPRVPSTCQQVSINSCQRSKSCTSIASQSKCSNQAEVIRTECGNPPNKSQCQPATNIPPTCPSIDRKVYPSCDCPLHSSCNPPNPVHYVCSNSSNKTTCSKEAIPTKSKSMCNLCEEPKNEKSTSVKKNKTKSHVSKVEDKSCVCGKEDIQPKSASCCCKDSEKPVEKGVKWRKVSKSQTEVSKPTIIDYSHKCLNEANCGVCYACRTQWSQCKKIVYGILGFMIFWLAILCPALLYYWLHKYQGGMHLKELTELKPLVKMQLVPIPVERAAEIKNQENQILPTDSIEFRADSANATISQHISTKSTRLHWHYVLMTLCLITVEAIALCLFRLFPFCPKWIVGMFHFLLHLSAACGAWFGVWLAWNYTVETKALHIHSVHACIGVVIIILFAVQFLVGLFSFFIIAIASSADTYRERLAPVHSAIGLSIFMLSVLCCATGLRQENEASLSKTAIIFINSIGLLFLIVAFLLAIFLSDTFRRPDQR